MNWPEWILTLFACLSWGVIGFKLGKRDGYSECGRDYKKDKSKGE